MRLSIGSSFAALLASHMVADHHVQRERDVQLKGRPGWEGRLACTRHVASYTATAAIALGAAAATTGSRLPIGRTLAALAVSGVSHWVIDRRTPLERFAKATGHADFYAMGAPREGHDDNLTLGTGAYALDQSAHIGFLFVAALIIAGGRDRQ